MGLLDKLESRLDSLINGSFNKAFKSEVEPVELASALQQELDLRATQIDGHMVAPNIFVIILSPEDHQRLANYFSSLTQELSVVALNYVREQRYSTVDSPEITFGQDPSLDTGVFRIRSTSGPRQGTAIPPVATPGAPVIPQMAATQVPRLITVSGEEYSLTNSITNIGRGSEANIQINDASVSRLHSVIILGSDVVIRDLSSTNGTLVDGERITEATLQDGSIIKIGNITLTYKSR